MNKEYIEKQIAQIKREINLTKTNPQYRMSGTAHDMEELYWELNHWIDLKVKNDS